MRTLSIDIETYSSVDLAKSGVYRYTEAPDFEILLFGYSVDYGPVKVIDLACDEKITKEIQHAILDNKVIKWAFNAQFERICLSRYLGIHLEPNSWRCTMVWSAYLGLPLSLEGAAFVTGADKKKLTEGKELIRYFSVPCKPTLSNGGRTRNLPEHAPNKWYSFKAYNVRDVEAELSIQAKLQKFPVPDQEWQNYILDQRINDRGIQLDLELVRQAIKCDDKVREKLTNKLQTLTELENPNSVAQMKTWLSEHGLETDSLDKASVKVLLKDAPDHLSEVLELRQLLAKSSVKKYIAMENAVCSDNRARGLIQFYGANRTGRFAGRLIQVQNLPQNHLPDLEQARRLVRDGHFEALELLYDSVPGVLSELIRTAFVPKEGYKFIVADFSAIEARVIAWLAGETWRNEVFATHGKIYEASASQMFRVPLEEVTKGSPLRQKGKIAELALGYGGSVGALKAMGALDMGLTEEELKPLVYTWRNANPNIVRLWWDVDSAVKEVVKERNSRETHCIRFEYRSGMLLVWLPSGRQLTYVKPRMSINSFGSEAVTYEGVGATKKWERIESYGPKFVENIVQAISRDLLCYAMRKLDESGFQIVMHVHDEAVLEVPLDVSAQEVCNLMGETPPWAKGLLLRADGYECNFYKKD
ncbi:DNA polymerase [Mobilisporobacter senegalensis]|uniref:DNA-directed DNA polymerase n=1 Tax=Mobilisporobacter senegalensis TaxID=1329262 RepID=A0A3N1XN62_9FIRM|nr:DNA polymerase [Mobilisporobacter senegalensis]ROR28125.1 DNA polymerase [Mobilisporobacter senegalensis]